ARALGRRRRGVGGRAAGGRPARPRIRRGRTAGRVIYVVAILGIIVLIFVHELGHFSAAMAVRMRPRAFYIGFGPLLGRVGRGGVEYGVRAIPAGGYVRLPGMHRPAAHDFEAWFRAAMQEAPELAPPVQRVRRALEADDFPAVRAEL